MFQLEGKEFAGIFKREFKAGLITTQACGGVKDVFSCHTTSTRNEDFDILNFRSTFQDDFRVNKLQDTTHVSLHFQLSGKSDAYISGFGKKLPMDKGRFNLLNCVDPVSTFVFPKQQQYEYLCVGIKPSFFKDVLHECGPAYEPVLQQSIRGESFSLFNPNHLTTPWQSIAVTLLQQPPVADSLKTVYIRSKVKELILLALGGAADYKRKADKAISVMDTERLNAVKHYLSAHYLSNFTLDAISRNFGLNEFKLKSGYKKLFGITVFHYIHQLRMQHAYNLLRDGDFTIGEIAALTGYNSDSAFIRAYKLYFGYPPGKHQLFT